jgi:TetR/AcrR family transcriptional repressor of nem operon
MGRPLKFEAEIVLDKAVDTFWRLGYAGTTPQTLVDELGIGKGSLYHSFDSKHNLFTLAMQRYSAERLQQLADVLRDGLLEDEPVLPQLRTSLQTLTGVGQHRRGCFIVNSVAELGQGDDTVTTLAKSLFDRIEDSFAAAVEKGRATGELTGDVEPRAAAQGLLATVIGTSVLAKTGTDMTILVSLLDDALARL